MNEIQPNYSEGDQIQSIDQDFGAISSDASLDQDFSEVGSDTSLEQIEVPEIPLTPELEAELRAKLEFLRENYDRFMIHFNNLNESFPEIGQRIRERYPRLTEHLEAIGSHNFNVSSLEPDEVIEAINTYNERARMVNQALSEFREFYSFDSTLSRVSNEETFEEIAEALSESEQEEIMEYALSIANEMIPRSQVETWTRRISGEITGGYDYEAGEYPDLEGWQHIAIAPAVGLEGLVRGVASLLNPRTYVDMYNGIKTISDLNQEEWSTIMHYIEMNFESLPTSRKVSTAISVIYSFVFLYAVIGVGATVPERISRILARSTIFLAETDFYLRAAPLAVLDNMRLELAEI
jgi:hypothetical protein